MIDCRRLAATWLLFTVLLAVASSAWAATSSPVALVHQGKDRSYRLYVPASLSGTPATVPLVLVLHGGGGNGGQIEWATRFRFNELAEQHRFVVAYPNGLTRGWNDGRKPRGALRGRGGVNDVDFLGLVVDHINTRLPVNMKRVFAAGMSNGGMMALRLACESTRFRAVASVAGTLPAPLETTCGGRPRGQRVSVLHIHGTDDTIVPYRGGHVNLLRQTNQRGQVLSAEQTFVLFGRVNQCSAPVAYKARDLFPDDTSVTRHTYQGCAHRAAVEQWRINGGGHTWPGGRSRAPRFVIGLHSRELDASAEIWRFFSAAR